MLSICKFNPVRDKKRVSPTGALDLKAAFANNAIPADLQVVDGKFNGIEEPEALTRVTDSIDAAMIEKQVRDYKPPVQNNE